MSCSSALRGVYQVPGGCGCIPPGLQPLAIARNSDLTKRLEVRDSQGSPIDLTGATITFTVVPKLGAASVIMKNAAPDIDIFDPRGGRADIVFKPADTVSLPAKDYLFDVWVKLASGAQQQIVAPSSFTIEQPVTKSP